MALAVLYVWPGLLVGFYLPYPPSFFITALSFVGYVVASRRSLVFAAAR